jgi:hypothetical protein
MKIKEASTKEIGDVLEKVCLLADINAPKEPPQIIAFMRKYFGAYELSDIELAFDKWIIGMIEIKKPMVLNAQFISSVIYAAIRFGYVVHDMSKKRADQTTPLPTKEELHQGYLDMADIWSRYENTKHFESFAKFFEIRYKYIYYNIDKMEYSEEERNAMANEIKTAIQQKDRRAKASISIFELMNMQDTPLPDLNWNRVACVCLHYRQEYNTKVKTK